MSTLASTAVSAFRARIKAAQIDEHIARFVDTYVMGKRNRRSSDGTPRLLTHAQKTLTTQYFIIFFFLFFPLFFFFFFFFHLTNSFQHLGEKCSFRSQGRDARDFARGADGRD
jgi:hypothetical protein